LRHAIKTSFIAPVGDRHSQVADSMAKPVLHHESYAAPVSSATDHMAER
jgi:hypothetical protein